ncbi:MAG: 3-deoxy-7-phosphoheptulonate synthase [Acidobacteriota bacterium]
MLVIVDPRATEEELAALEEKLTQYGLMPHLSKGPDFTAVALLAEKCTVQREDIQKLPGVRQVLELSEPYKLASRAFHPHPTVVRVGGTRLGGPEVVMMAGPCSVESRDHVMEMARITRSLGITILRGGAFKPRTSPYAFQGLGEVGLKYLREAADRYGLSVVSEIMDPSQIPLMKDYTDIYQVGARNMQNYALLTELGKVHKPVLLKRGISATIREWLMAAEYILSGGNYDVILCERGIRTFETATRNTFDVSAVPVVKELTHLPVIVDPSHAIGVRNKVIPLARAGIAAGADGLMLEYHTCPEEALSDGPQALYPEQLEKLLEELDGICRAIGRTLLRSPSPKGAESFGAVGKDSRPAPSHGKTV